MKKLPKPSIKYKFFPLILMSFVILYTLYFILSSAPSALAQIYVLPRPGAHSTTVSGSVGDFYLNVTGYIAPFASIVLTSQGVYLRATTADQFGYFTISQVLIKKGFSSFCFDAVDFRRLGESFSCINIPPANAAVSLKNIFLPPTLGLSRSQIAEGASTVAWGYSMPGALVTLRVNDQTYKTYADSTGYYQVVLQSVKAGVYKLSSRANLDHKDSLEPGKKVILTSLSWWEQLLLWLVGLWKKFLEFLTSLSLGPLWIAIPAIIVIVILILRIWPERFTIIYQSKLMVFFSKSFKRHRPLHHEYFVGY